MRRLTFALVVMACALLPATAGAAVMNAAPSTFSSQFAAAQGGDTILLASGSYGSFTYSAAKSSEVVIAPQLGATVSMGSADFLSSARNITIRGITYTGPVEVRPPTTSMGLLFDGVTWGAVGAGTYEGRLSIVGGGTTQRHGNGVQVKNSTFGPGGCSDGIQDSSMGTEIGPGNEFKGIVQACSASSAHVDAIQPYDSNYIHIHDNYMHDNEQGVMSPDGVSMGYFIEDNVIHTTNAYPCMHLGNTRSIIVRHNVCRNGSIRVYGGNQNVASQNATVQDNVASVDASACTGCTIDHNLSPAQVTFAGTPAGRCAYATSTPAGTGTNGSTVGLGTCGSSTPPPPPPLPPPVEPAAPIAAYTYAPASPTTGQDVSFDASSSTCAVTPCSYTWADDGSDGAGGEQWPLGTGQTLSFTFTGAGDKHVRLTVTDAQNRSASTVQTITVATATPPPDPAYTPICKPLCDDTIATLTSKIDRMHAIADRSVTNATAATLRQRLLDIRAIAHE